MGDEGWSTGNPSLSSFSFLFHILKEFVDGCGQGMTGECEEIL